MPSADHSNITRPCANETNPATSPNGAEIPCFTCFTAGDLDTVTARSMADDIIDHRIETANRDDVMVFLSTRSYLWTEITRLVDRAIDTARTLMADMAPAPARIERPPVEAPQGLPVIVAGTIGEEEAQTVNARDLHAFLGVGKRFADWIKDRVQQYGFQQGVDFEVFPETGKNPSGGRPTVDYALTLDMAKELAMVERNEKGKEARRYFIDCERKAKAAARLPSMARALAAITERLVAIETAVAVGPTTFLPIPWAGRPAPAGCHRLRDAARILGLPPGKFCQWLVMKDFLYRRGKNLIPRKAEIRAGRFVHEPAPGSAWPATMLTDAGVRYLMARMEKKKQSALGRRR